MAPISVWFAPELRLFLRARHRSGGRAQVAHGCTDSLGHVVESLGVPLPEVGRLTVDGIAVPPSHRVHDGAEIEVRAVDRPQPGPHRFVLDVHLGTLARRLRLLGVDVAYDNDRDDDALIAQAVAEGRILLTKDRRLLRRRGSWRGAFVRGTRPDDQLDDALHRFAPPLHPWTRCPACNGALVRTAKREVEHLLEDGTRRTYDEFARCRECARIYWRGAHSGRLEAIVDRARRTRGLF